MSKYNFDEIIPREGTNSLKYDARKQVFNSSDILPLWVADTDFKTPDFIVNAIKKRAEHEIFGYTFKPDSYYRSIIGWMQRRHNWSIKKEWISFSPGVVAGLTCAIKAFSNPGDGVVVQPPVYSPFFSCVEGTGREIVRNPLIIKNNRYTFDFHNLKSQINKKTRLLLLCNPHNPGGMVWKNEELEELGSICNKNDILIISDEIHSDLIFKGNRHIPITMVSEETAKNSIILSAPSKTFNIAGLTTSVVIIPDKKKFEQFEKILNLAHLGMGNIFGAVALEAAYSYGDEWLNQLLDYLWNNYLYLKKFFNNNLPEVKVMNPEATYLVWLDFREYRIDGKELTKLIVDKAKVGLNNGAGFGIEGNGWMRLNIGCPRSVLAEGLNRLNNAFSGI
ncbi:MAG: putative C-S lyase [Bacteroidales bacterium]|nr:putative C-S lyase [Bacteroidales bacterium]